MFPRKLLHLQCVPTIKGNEHGNQDPEECDGNFAGFLVLVIFVCGQALSDPSQQIGLYLNNILAVDTPND